MSTIDEFIEYASVLGLYPPNKNTGTVTSIATGTGLTGGTITSSGTISFAAIAANTFWANLTGSSAVPTATTISTLFPLITSLGTQTANLNMGGFQVNMVATPVAAGDAVNKAYADNIAGGFNPIAGVLGASTANLAGYTYSNGSSGVGATLTAGSNGVFIADGVTYSGGNVSSFLYKNDTTYSGVANGIYTITTSTSGSPAVLTRRANYNTPEDINPGDLVAVESGTVNAETSWYQTSTIVGVGTTAIAFSPFFQPASFLQSANNLSDLTSVSTARANLGVAIGTNVEAWSSILDTVAAGTYTGSTSITTLGTIATGTWNATNIALGKGGTGAALTAAAGAVAYSTASAMALSAVGTSGFPLVSKGTSAPLFTSLVTLSQIFDLNNNKILTFTPVTSAVNYVAIQNSPTNQSLQIQAQGSDSNIALAFLGKGTSGSDIGGFTDGSSAVSGYVGELISSIVPVASSVNMPSNTQTNITSISVPAGDWDIWGNVSIGAETTAFGMYGWTSTVSATIPDASLTSALNLNVSGGLIMQGNSGITVPMRPFQFSTTTTVYLSGIAEFTSGSVTMCGGIYARRRR
jgi:hypothetical protein